MKTKQLEMDQHASGILIVCFLMMHVLWFYSLENPHFLFHLLFATAHLVEIENRKGTDKSKHLAAP